MIKKIIGTVCLILLINNSCVAQSTNHQTNADWGKNINGVQLSIDLTNNIVETGSTITTSIKIKNSSENSVYLAQVGLLPDFNISLTDVSGKIYKCTPNHLHDTFTSRIQFKIKPGEARNWMMPVKIPSDIKSGDYTLKATHFMNIDGIGFELESNLLKVQIK